MKSIKAVLKNKNAILTVISRKAIYQKVAIASSVLLCLGMGQNCAPAQFSSLNEPGMPHFAVAAGAGDTAGMTSDEPATQQVTQQATQQITVPVATGDGVAPIQTFDVPAILPDVAVSQPPQGGDEHKPAGETPVAESVAASSPSGGGSSGDGAPVYFESLPIGGGVEANVTAHALPLPVQSESQGEKAPAPETPAVETNVVVAEVPPPAQVKEEPKAEPVDNEPAKAEVVNVPQESVAAVTTPSETTPSAAVTEEAPTSSVDVCMDIEKIDHKKRDRTMTRVERDDENDGHHKHGKAEHDEHGAKKHGHVAVVICHKGRTLTVDIEGALHGHTKHGDYLGACGEPAVSQCKPAKVEVASDEKHEKHEHHGHKAKPDHEEHGKKVEEQHAKKGDKEQGSAHDKRAASEPKKGGKGC